MQKIMQSKDERIKLLSEVIEGIKVMNVIHSVISYIGYPKSEKCQFDVDCSNMSFSDSKTICMGNDFQKQSYR